MATDLSKAPVTLGVPAILGDAVLLSAVGEEFAPISDDVLCRSCEERLSSEGESQMEKRTPAEAYPSRAKALGNDETRAVTLTERQAWALGVACMSRLDADTVDLLVDTKGPVALPLTEAVLSIPEIYPYCYAEHVAGQELEGKIRRFANQAIRKIEGAR